MVARSYIPSSKLRALRNICSTVATMQVGKQTQSSYVQEMGGSMHIYFLLSFEDFSFQIKNLIDIDKPLGVILYQANRDFIRFLTDCVYLEF